MVASGAEQSPNVSMNNQVAKNIEFNIQHINNKIYQMKMTEGTHPSNIPASKQAIAGSKTKLKKKSSLSGIKDFNKLL